MEQLRLDVDIILLPSCFPFIRLQNLSLCLKSGAVNGYLSPFFEDQNIYPQKMAGGLSGRIRFFCFFAIIGTVNLEKSDRMNS